MTLGYSCCGSLVTDRHYEGCPRNEKPENRLARNTSDDPSGSKLLRKISSIEPEPDDSGEFVDRFSVSYVAMVKAVGERTTTVIEDAEKYGEAIGESKGVEATTEVSLGWWLSLENWPMALFLGAKKPRQDIAAGDIIDIVMRKRRRSPGSSTSMANLVDHKETDEHFTDNSPFE